MRRFLATKLLPTLYGPTGRGENQDLRDNSLAKGFQSAKGSQKIGPKRSQLCRDRRLWRRTLDEVAKAKAARTWVGHANVHVQTYAGKPWRCVLIPHDEVVANATLAGLAGKFAQTAIVEV
jgi:hypothetical protein